MTHFWFFEPHKQATFMYLIRSIHLHLADSGSGNFQMKNFDDNTCLATLLTKNNMLLTLNRTLTIALLTSSAVYALVGCFAQSSDDEVCWRLSSDDTCTRFRLLFNRALPASCMISLLIQHCLLFNQVIVGRMRAQTGSSFTGMATSVMRTSPSLFLLNLLQLRIRYQAEGSGILSQETKESRWCSSDNSFFFPLCVAKYMNYLESMDVRMYYFEINLVQVDAYSSWLVGRMFFPGFFFLPWHRFVLTNWEQV